MTMCKSTHNQKHSVHHLMLMKILIPTDEIGLQDSCQIVLGVCWSNSYQLLGFCENKQHKMPPQQITNPSLNLYEWLKTQENMYGNYIVLFKMSLYGQKGKRHRVFSRGLHLAFEIS